MMYVSQIIMLHTLNLHSAVCQLYLNKIERKKKEWSSDTCYNMDEPWKYYAQSNKPDIKKTSTVWVHIYEVPTIQIHRDRK